MDNGWQSSAAAWIADMGDRGDFGRRFVLDPVMLPLALARSPRTGLDVGCGRDDSAVPLSYFRLLLSSGLTLTHFDEPAPIAGAPAYRADGYRRAPWFLVMEWTKASGLENQSKGQI